MVISGISVRFPESENIAEFQEHLMNGDDMVTEDNRRWEPGKTRFLSFDQTPFSPLSNASASLGVQSSLEQISHRRYLRHSDCGNLNLYFFPSIYADSCA